MTKKTKIIIGIISSIGLIITTTIIICYAYIILKFSDFGGDFSPKIVDSIDSPNERYTMNIYFLDGGPISADSEIVEILDHKKNKKWNLYYENKGNLKEYKWINNNTVSINNKKINIHKEEYPVD